ncbi:hypothetical protein LY76DRAFT_351814 [Colletotrichum caudatum]|nr:hypothetical protein LY76DRAFT_351814 [Colletotrichum caudatum]
MYIQSVAFAFVHACNLHFDPVTSAHSVSIRHRSQPTHPWGFLARRCVGHQGRQNSQRCPDPATIWQQVWQRVTCHIFWS